MLSQRATENIIKYFTEVIKHVKSESLKHFREFIFGAWFNFSDIWRTYSRRLESYIIVFYIVQQATLKWFSDILQNKLKAILNIFFFKELNFQGLQNNPHTHLFSGFYILVLTALSLQKLQGEGAVIFSANCFSQTD